MAIIGLIPAAGKGTRLSPLPFSKELYPIGYQDVIVNGKATKAPKVVSQYLVNHMVKAGVETIFMTIGPGKSDIMECFGSGKRHGVNIVYNFQSEPKGMPYALDLSYPFITSNDTVVFGMSDTIIEPEGSFIDLMSFYNESKADLILGLFRTQNPSKFGMVDIDPETYKVLSTIDKPAQTNLAYMWGCCIWNHKFAKFMHDYLANIGVQEKEVVFGDIINAAMKSGLKVYGHPVDKGRYIDIGTIEDLDQALKNFQLK